MPYAAATDPAALLYASYRPSPNVSAGPDPFTVGKEGVARVKLTDDSRVNLGEGVPVYVTIALVSWSLKFTAKSGSITVWLGLVAGPATLSTLTRPSNCDLAEIR